MLMTSLLQGTAKRRAVPEPHDRHHTMNILMITANDPAGMGIAFTNAINRYTEHTCRLITTAEMYGLDFEKDIHLPDIHDDDFGEVEHLLNSKYSGTCEI